MKQSVNKGDLIREVCTLLKENDIKKPVSTPKNVFHISDDNGNSKDFTIKQTNKSVMYTADDVRNIFDACIGVIEESLKHGKTVNISGFGSFGVKYRKPRATKMVGTDEDILIEGRYVPKFSFGNDLRMCAKIYELSLCDNTDMFEDTAEMECEE